LGDNNKINKKFYYQTGQFTLESKKHWIVYGALYFIGIFELLLPEISIILFPLKLLKYINKP